jgi:hypothetical protein
LHVGTSVLPVRWVLPAEKPQKSRPNTHFVTDSYTTGQRFGVLNSGIWQKAAKNKGRGVFT